MVVLVVGLGILVVLGVVGYFATRHRSKNQQLSWDPRRDAVQAKKDSEDTTPRPQYGSVPYEG